MDDLAYLAKHKIDRNLVSREIAEITARMIHITGASRVSSRRFGSAKNV